MNIIRKMIEATVNEMQEEKEAQNAGWSVLKFYAFLFQCGLGYLGYRKNADEIEQLREKHIAAEKTLRELLRLKYEQQGQLQEILDATETLRADYRREQYKAKRLKEAKELVDTYEEARRIVAESKDDHVQEN